VLLIKHSSLENMKVMLYILKYMLMILSLVQIITMCEEFLVAMQDEFEMSMMGDT